MATLKKHGHEIARFEYLADYDAENAPSRALSRRIVYSVRSTGAILRKHMALFPAGQYCESHWHDYGWKIAAWPRTARDLEYLRPALLAKGFHEVSI